MLSREFRCKGALVITLWRLVKGSFLGFWELQWFSRGFQASPSHFVCANHNTTPAAWVTELAMPQIWVMSVMWSSQAFRWINGTLKSQIRSGFEKRCQIAIIFSFQTLQKVKKPKLRTFFIVFHLPQEPREPPTQTSAAKLYSQAATSGAQYSGDPKTSVRNAPSWGEMRRWAKAHVLYGVWFSEISSENMWKWVCFTQPSHVHLKVQLFNALLLNVFFKCFQVWSPGLDSPRCGVDICNNEPLVFGFNRNARAVLPWYSQCAPFTALLSTSCMRKLGC